MNTELTEQRDTILIHALPHVAFDGWTMEALQQGAQDAGHEALMADAVFPEGVRDAMEHLADWADRQMQAKLERMDLETMRTRDIVAYGVVMRLQALNPYKDAVGQAMRLWLRPDYAPQAGRVLWRTADRIWKAAGDQAEDYNHYTKRGLLVTVLSSTGLYWLNADETEEMEKTKAFADRRIEEVLKTGQTLGPVLRTVLKPIGFLHRQRQKA